MAAVMHRIGTKALLKVLRRNDIPQTLALALADGGIKTKDELTRAIWSPEHEPKNAYNNLQIHILRLRRKGYLIITYPQFGYQLLRSEAA